MDFEKAYQKFLNGTASPEETEFVRSEMKKASEVNDILANVKRDGATAAAEKETVRRAIKTYRKKDTIKILIIVCASLLVLAIGVGLAVGIPILSNASDNMLYTVDQAKEIALEHISGRYPNAEIYSVERELEVEGRIKNARYIYVLDVYNGINEVIEIEVDSKTGRILDVD